MSVAIRLAQARESADILGRHSIGTAEADIELGQVAEPRVHGDAGDAVPGIARVGEHPVGQRQAPCVATKSPHEMPSLEGILIVRNKVHFGDRRNCVLKFFDAPGNL